MTSLTSLTHLITSNQFDRQKQNQNHSLYKQKRRKIKHMNFWSSSKNVNKFNFRTTTEPIELIKYRLL